jgi:uncharacterized cupin superfamily protein
MSTYTLKNLEDTTDMAAEQGMGDTLEAHFPREELGCERIGFSLQRLKPGRQLPFAHTHKTDEELYVVLSGGGQAHVDGDLLDLRPMDVLRCAPSTARSFSSGPDGLELLVFGTHHDDDSELAPSPWEEG